MTPIRPDPLVIDCVDQDERGIGSRCVGIAAAAGACGAIPPAPRVAAPRRTSHNRPMTRSELIDRIAQNQSRLAERDVELAVKMMLNHMAECLAGGGRIEIRGFGSFSLRFRRARVGRNPRTAAAVSLPARYAVNFKPGMRLRERVDLDSRGPAEAHRHAGRSEDPPARSGE